MSTLIFTSLIAALFVTVYFYVKNAYAYWKRKEVTFIEPSFPLGNIQDIFLQRTSFSDAIKKVYDSSHDSVVGIYSFLTPLLVVPNPKIIRDILIKEFSSFNHRGVHVNENVDPMAGNILLQKDDKWKNARTNLSPAFSSGKLKEMFGNIISCTTSLQDYVGRYSDQKQTVEIQDVFARYATNIIASVSFGIRIETLIEDRDSKFREHGKQIFEPTFWNVVRGTFLFLSPLISRIFRIRFADKEVGEFMIDTVKRNLEYREKNNVSRKDFFQMLVQLRNTGKIDDDNDWSIKGTSDKKLLSLEEMSAQAFLFFAGGYESSSTTMSFCMYELAKNPNIQQKVYEEIVTTLESHDGQLTYESVAEMKFMDNCIEETLRMHAPFGIIVRVCVKDYKLPDSDVVIEKGTKIFLSVDGLQYDKQYYDQPNKFIPERFDKQQSADKTFAEMPFLAFGDGLRNCLGLRLGKLQSKLAIITLLQKYRFELAEEHFNKELVLIPQSVTKCPVNGINLKVFAR